MVKFEDLVNGNYTDPGFFFMDFEQWFNFLPLAKQILLVILLVLLAVGILVLNYYILKATAYLIYYVFKGLYYVFKFAFYDVPKWLFEKALESGDQTKHQSIPHQTTVKTSVPRRNIDEKYTQYDSNDRSRPNNSSVAVAVAAASAPAARTISRALHCPMCENNFTPDMKSVLEKNSRVYCEYCGYNLEMATR